MTLPAKLGISLDREEDGRWIACVDALPGVMAYGKTRVQAIRAVEALALRVLADKLEHGELSEDPAISFTVPSKRRAA